MIHCSNDYGPGFCKGAGVYLDNYFSTKNSYVQNLSFIYVENIDGTDNFKTSLGLGKFKEDKHFSIIKRLYDIEFPELINNQRFLLHFNNLMLMLQMDY